MKSILTFVVLAACVVASSAYSGEPEKLLIRGEEFPIWPVEDLARRGMPVESIPRDQNAAWVYIEAINSYVDVPPTLSEALDFATQTAWPEGHIELRKFLLEEKNVAALRACERASRMERCLLPVNGTPDQSVIGVLLPNLSHIRVLGKLLVADGRRCASEGLADDAILRYKAGIRMGSHMSNGMTLIESLVGIAVGGRANLAIIDLVLRYPMSMEQLKALQEELTDLSSKVPNVQKGLKGECAFGPAMVDDIFSAPFRVFNNVAAFTASTSGNLGGPAAINPAEDGWGKFEKRVGQLLYPDRTIKKHMQGYYDLVQDSGKRGTRADSWELVGGGEAKYLAEKIPKWDVISRALLPSLSRAILLGERMKAEFAAARALVALRIHMLENDGKAPSNLSDLAKGLPDGAFNDPFGDGLLRYRKTDTGFVLYSVGPDHVDNGGKAGKKWEEGDMVWTYPPAPVEPFMSESKKD